MIRTVLIGVVSGVSLTACATVGPDYVTPDVVLGPSVSSLAEDSVVFSQDPVTADWWSRFDDPVLTDLLSQVNAHNTDIEASLARIVQARAQLSATRARGVPSLAVTGNAQRLRSSEIAGGFGPPPGAPSTQNLFGFDLAAAWEIDLFGRLSRAMEAASARVELSEAESEAVRLSISAATAEAYFSLRGIQTQLSVLERNIETARGTLALTEQLVEREIASDFDLLRARAEVRTVEAAFGPLQAAERALAAQLAVLAGERPDQLAPRLLHREPAVHEPARVAVGLPSHLLERRPDIIAAERNLAAATAQIGVARANFFPAINLTGNAGALASQAGDLFDEQARSAGIGAFINLPLFDGGARRAALTQAEAEAESALAAYRGAVLRAFGDVEAAMAAYAFGQEQIEYLSQALADRDRALALARARYEAGLDDLFALLDAQRSHLSAEANLASARTDLLIAYVALFRALGGGWTETAQE